MSMPMHHASINGTSLAFTDEGSGAPIVFVHGGFTDHRIWAPQVAEFARSHRCIAIDQRYFGLSWQGSGPRYSLATHGQDLCRFMAKVCADPVHLVASSYGSAVALYAAVECPGLVKSLFLNEPSLAWIVTDAADRALLASERSSMAPVAQALADNDAPLAVRLFCDWTAFPGAFGTLPEEYQAIFLDNARTIGPHFAAPAPTLLQAQIAALEMPVSFTVGEKTRPYFRAMLRAACQALPDATVTVIPGAHHGAPFENAAAFNAALLSHLTRDWHPAG
jgi:pimeloyl-ACP methyl ester carboxylesterase